MSAPFTEDPGSACKAYLIAVLGRRVQSARTELKPYYVSNFGSPYTTPGNVQNLIARHLTIMFLISTSLEFRFKTSGNRYCSCVYASSK